MKDARLHKLIDEFDGYSTRHLKDVVEAVSMIIEARKAVCEALRCPTIDDVSLTQSLVPHEC